MLISRLDERFKYTRARAALGTAEALATPDSVLNDLSEGLWRHCDPALAERLLRRKWFADTSRALLGAVAEVEIIEYGHAAKSARERLAELDAQGTSRIAEFRPPAPPPPIQTAPAPGWSGESGQADQCLAPDDWSDSFAARWAAMREYSRATRWAFARPQHSIANSTFRRCGTRSTSSACLTDSSWPFHRRVRTRTLRS